MHRTVQTLRLILPIVFFGFLGILAFSYSSNRDRHRTTPTPIGSAIRPADKPKAEFHEFEDTQTIGGQVVSRIRARRTVAFSSGWNTLEDVQLTIYRKNGLTYELSCPVAEFQGETKAARARGGVRIVSNDGMEIITEGIDFDGARLLNQIPVQFKVDRWKGRAGGVDLNARQETLRLLGEIDVALESSDAGEPPLSMRAGEGLFARSTGEASFYPQVELRRGPDRLRTDHLRARFDQSRKILVGLEGTGNVNVRMAGESALSNSANQELGRGEKQITSERFYTEFGPQGDIRAFFALGDRIQSHALLLGPPRREITAKVFRIGMSGAVLKELRADGDVKMQELGPSPRVITSKVMIVFFDEKTRSAVSASVAGHVRYRDARNEATGETASYYIPEDFMIFTAHEGAAPTITSEGNTLKANSIEFAPKAGTFKATGNVQTWLQTKQKGAGTTASDTMLFPDATGTVFVNSDSLLIKQKEKLASFSGNVRAWQGTNTLFSNEMHVVGAGESLRATGNVRAVLYNARGAAPKKNPLKTRSDELIARKIDQRIELHGAVQVDDEGRRMNAGRATIFLDSNRKIDRVEANDSVIVTESATGRRGTGQKVVYQLVQKRLVLEGTPAELSEARGTVKGSRVVFDIEKNKVDVVSGEVPTEATYNPKQVNNE